MAKRRPAAHTPKSARDKAIDRALLSAAKHVSADAGGTILVRLSGQGAATFSRLSKSEKAKPATDTVNPNTAMALALAKAGLGAAKQPEKLKHPKPAARPQKAVAAPAPPKKPAATPQSPRNIAKPPNLTTKQPSTKGTKRQINSKQLLASVHAAAQRERAEDDRQRRKAIAEEGRSERMQDRQKEAARAIASIGQASADELLDLWRQNITRMENQHSAFRGLASDYIEAIESEWTRRSIIARLDPDFFKWPSTKAAPGNGTFAALDYAEGILGYLGYHVGKTGESSSARRQTLLSRVFEGSLPPINGAEYMREWHKAGSAIRLEKMAVSIASAVKSAKRRRDADYGVAIEHWEEDLKYLHRAYYIGRFAFDWPSSVSGGQI